MTNPMNPASVTFPVIDHDPSLLGFVAYHDGVRSPRDYNPFENHSIAAREWIEGWMRAERVENTSMEGWK